MEDVSSYIVIVVSIVVIVAYMVAVRPKSSPVPKPTVKRAQPPKFNVEKLEQRIRRRLKENN